MGAELKHWRKRLGWTQQQAADYLGIPVRTYEAWEREWQTKRPGNPGAVRKLMQQAVRETVG